MGTLRRSFTLGALLGINACAGGARDVVPESHDVRGAQDAAPAPPAAADTYSYVAKRPHGVVALAEARGVSPEIAARAVDHLADELEACAVRLLKEQKLVEGAGRVVAQIAPDGTVRGLAVKAQSGGGVAANLLTCVVAPLRLTTFPAESGDAGARGLAIETEWGLGRAPRDPDAGG